MVPSILVEGRRWIHFEQTNLNGFFHRTNYQPITPLFNLLMDGHTFYQKQQRSINITIGFYSMSGDISHT